MTTIYFAFFCVGIFFIIVWALKNDDYNEFFDGKEDKRFSIEKARAIQAVRNKDENAPK